MVEGGAGAAPAVRPEVEGFLARALQTLPPARLRLVTLPAPAAPLERVWAAWPAADAVLWHPPAGPGAAGVGSALRLEAAGPGRFETLEGALEEATQKAAAVAAFGVPADGVELFGGFAFACGGAVGDPWAPLGDSQWLLPRWVYRCDRAGARLTLAVPAGEVPRAQELVGEYGHFCRILASPSRAAMPPAVLDLREEPPPGQWEKTVAAAGARIRAGELAKVVLGRRFVVTAGRSFDAEELLAHLARQEGSQYRFGFRLGGRVLVGASPELLVAKRGMQVTSEALAGSVVRREGGVEDDELLARLRGDPKQMEEHALVVEAIRDVFQGVCSTLDVPPQPRLKLLRHLAHLVTPFTGTLTAPLSVLRVAALLHPTPAVGGVPREAAQALIAACEDAPRGWFAGPVGVVSTGGEGELAVALRCALLAGPKAYIWAGAGIVAASDPAEEVKETGAKATAALAALGLAP